jgi:hypothetical protein
MFLKRRVKRLRITRSMSVVRRRGAKLAAVAAGLVALAAFAAVPAAARHDARGDRPAARALGTSIGPVVNFRRNAFFTCFGGFGGTPTANTANITIARIFVVGVNATVTVHAPAGTRVFGQLVQSGCSRVKSFSFTVPASGVGTTNVVDLAARNIGINDAFVWFNDTVGDFQITPEVILF